MSVVSDDGTHPLEMQRSVMINGQTTTESYLYAYGSAGASENRLESLTVRRRTDTGPWQNIQRVVYSYYGAGDSFGNLGDLQTATTEQWLSSVWNETGTSYYRYYKTGESNGFQHGLRYVVDPQGWKDLESDPGVSDPLTASNAQVSLYADYFFEYDSARRVTRESVNRGARTFTFSYSQSSFLDDYNHWKFRTVETLPDGTQNIVYSNYAGFEMLSVQKFGTDQWYRFTEFNSDGRAILRANPSAISGYDDQYADLLNKSGGSYQYLKNSDGLLSVTDYYQSGTAKGRVKVEMLRHGQNGADVKLREYEFTSRTVGDVTITPVSKQIIYPSETNQTEQIATTYSYTYHTGTVQTDQRTVTLPIVPVSQNGSGVAATLADVLSIEGRLNWHRDERGYIAHSIYDAVTGAVVQQISDLDTSQATGVPSGWVTPSDGGLNLITDFEHDDRGRVTQSLGPVHTIDLNGTATSIRRATWNVYLNTSSGKEMRAGSGYATGTGPSYTYTLINPVAITKTSLSGRVRERIEATRASTSGKLLPTDTFAQASYTSWSTLQYIDCCLVASERVYHTIPATGEGQSGVNYDEIVYGYDAMKRRNRTVTPGGTIDFVVYGSRNFQVASYTGTDDTGCRRRLENVAPGGRKA